MKKTLLLAAFLICTGVLVFGLNAEDESTPAVDDDAELYAALPGGQDGYGPRRGRGYGDRREMIAEELGITDEQRDAIEAMRSEHQKEMITIGARVAVLRIELRDLMKEQGNDAAVQTKHAELLAVTNELQEMQFAHKLEMRKLFTAEQWEKVAPMMGKAKGRRGLHDDSPRGHSGRGFGAGPRRFQQPGN